MPRISVPADRDPLRYLWTEHARTLTPSAGAFTNAVYEKSTLPLREFEAARVQIARINDCDLCLGWRSARDVKARQDDPDPPGEDFYDNVGANPAWDGFSARERLAMEFAERFAVDHTNIDDDLWAHLHAAFTDSELVEFGLCIGAWIAFGRLNRVFDVDGGCRVPTLPSEA
ncbi:MAG: carboxymuconolactone decarboxylase family protein [Actinomycetota bacterium]|nr:carboxymuconolactone decarboxylase family protein [Acidimicrobiia bacterium]MDQ3293469.1 carboxymuconolactone decarboxylase family protein [Actinomycetota bacterium]